LSIKILLENIFFNFFFCRR